MASPRTLSATTLVALAAVAAGCALLTPFDVAPTDTTDGGADGGRDGGDAEAADGDVDAPDGGGPEGAGPLLLVVRTVDALPDAICDVDGDGEHDGAIAALGREEAVVLAAAFSSFLAAGLDPGDRLAIFLRQVDDLSGPDMEAGEAAPFGARDTDVPPNTADDFDGDEPFYIGRRYVDECGEPIHGYTALRVEDGVVSGGAGTMSFMLSQGSAIELIVTEHRGTIAPGGASFDIEVCGWSTITALGGTADATGDVGGLSVLEVMVGGGDGFGFPGLPGLQPDVDFDHDGLERIELDGDGRVLRCIDGDRTVLEGRDCWADPRIADGFALVFRLQGSSGRFAGPVPGWQRTREWTCDVWPPEERFFDTAPPVSDACADLDELCAPLSEEPCCNPDHRCSGEDEHQYRCSEVCTPVDCVFLGRAGTCDVAADFPVCRPVWGGLGSGDCEAGTTGCTTAWDVSSDTACIGIHGKSYCFETCPAVEAPCPADHYCVPRLFDETAVCVFR